MATVLVIDDDEDMREIARATLAAQGHDVMVAGNGRDALEALAQQQPCIILLDLMMPVMDGLTFLSETKRRGLAPRVPIVCVTAGGEEMRNHALRLGACQCLPKPTDFDELGDVVARYCGA